MSCLGYTSRSISLDWLYGFAEPSLDLGVSNKTIETDDGTTSTDDINYGKTGISKNDFGFRN